MSERGLFIVLEGSDGSGKTTQFNLLAERLRAVGYDVAVFDFPRYDKDSSYFVRQYLNGRYGRGANISPYVASLFYALDRYEAAKDINKALNEGKIVLANRYAGSNMAHQGAKLDDSVEQRSFFVWADNLEFQLLSIPRPDVNFFLRVPADISYSLIAKKDPRAYTKNKRDEHEQDKEHLRKSVATYDLLCQLFPKDFKAIECTSNNRLMNVAEINDRLWQKLKPMLPSKKPHSSHSVVVTLGAQPSSLPALSSPDEDELEHCFKNASLLLKLHLQRLGLVGNAAEFNTWQQSGYRFFTPSGLARETADTYVQVNQRLGEIQAELSERLAKHAPSSRVADLILAITPLSALADITIRLKKKNIYPVAGSLLAGDTAEEQSAAKQLYMAARQKWPDFEQPLESRDGPVSLNNIIAKLADERLPRTLSSDEQFKLLEARPRLEFDLLAESIYPHSSLSLDEIAEEVSNWPYSQKYDSLKEAASQPEILKKVRYKLDVLTDNIILNKIISAGSLKDVQAQSITPRYGYDVPTELEAAGTDELYDEAFDESIKLFSILQAAGAEEFAAYACLLGHKVRWQLNATAAELQPVLSAESLTGASDLKNIAEKVAEVHPLLWEVIGNAHIAPRPPATNGKSRVKPLHQRSSKKRSPRKNR